MTSLSDSLIAVYRQQYADGRLELGEFERLVGQALRGGLEAEADFKRLAFEARLRSAYRGPIRDMGAP